MSTERSARIVPSDAAPAEPVRLQARPFRSVTSERGEHGEAVVVKRFHHPNPLLALLDGARARREFGALQALERAGLPVPHPRALRRTSRGWEVHLAPVAGALDLGELLLDGTPPGGWPRLAARLGALLAALQASGWRHGDLHADNVLVDAAGRPWLIDFHRSRRGARPTEEQRIGDLVLAAAAARETLAPRVRARFLIAWERALPEELRPRGMRAAPDGRSALAGLVERAARLRRRQLVSVGLGRWLRESSRVRCVPCGASQAWIRRDLDPSALETPVDEARFLVLRGARRALRRPWLAAARLHEHRVPVARPAAFFPGRRWSGADALATFEPPARAARAATLAALLATLEERGLTFPAGVAAEELALGTASTGFYFRPPRALRELDLELQPGAPRGP